MKIDYEASFNMYRKETYLGISQDKRGGGSPHHSTLAITPGEPNTFRALGIIEHSTEIDFRYPLDALTMAAHALNRYVHQSGYFWVQMHVARAYPAGWVVRPPRIPEDAIVPAIWATNLPEDDAVWLQTQNLIDDAYGIAAYEGDYEVLDLIRPHHLPYVHI